MESEGVMRRTKIDPIEAAKSLAKTTEDLRDHNNEKESRQSESWIGSLEKLRLRTEEQKALNDAHDAKKRK